MSPPPILSSPFMNLSLIDTLLRASPQPPAAERIRLLSARMYLLETRTTEADATKFQRMRNEVQVLRARLDLARAHLDTPRGDTDAEAELQLVEKGCKGIIKGLKKTTALSEQQQDESESREREDVLQIARELRISGLREMIVVDQRLGRSGRAERWKASIAELEAESVRTG